MFDIDGVRGELEAGFARVRAAGASVAVADWVGLVGSCQAAMNVLGAMQAVALAHVAAIEEVAREDGTVQEVHRGLGHERLDAPCLVQDLLGLTPCGATDRVAGAVGLVTRHPGLVQAMGSGRLDGYRAGVVAGELLGADADVCAVVVERLLGSLGERLAGEAGGALRRRTRRLLAGVDADLVARRAVRARSERSLRRSAFAPGVDEWSATLPVEASRVAWSVVDDLARRYVAEGTCAGLEQARADALLDLVLSRATGTVGVTLTVAAGAMSRAAQEATQQAGQVGPVEAGDPLVPVTGFGMPGVTQVRASWLASVVDGSASSAGLASAVHVVACDDRTGAVTSLPVPVGATGGRSERTAAGRRESLAAAERGEPTGYRPPPWLVGFVKARDGRCRFPGCEVGARFCDVDHVVAWPAGATHPSNLVCLCRRHHRVKQRPGWRVRFDPDGALVWTDPCDRQRSTMPEDRLQLDLADLPAQRHVARPYRPAPVPGRQPVPSLLEDELEVAAGRHLIDLACHPDLITVHNRRALRTGRRVTTTAVALIRRPGHDCPDVRYPTRALRLDPSLGSCQRGQLSQGHETRGRRGTRSSPWPSGEDPAPF